MDVILDSLVYHAPTLVMAGVAVYSAAALMLEIAGRFKPKRWKRLLLLFVSILWVGAQFAEGQESSDRYLWVVVGGALGLFSAYRLQQAQAKLQLTPNKEMTPIVEEPLPYGPSAAAPLPEKLQPEGLGMDPEVDIPDLRPVVEVEEPSIPTVSQIPVSEMDQDLDPETLAKLDESMQFEEWNRIFERMTPAQLYWMAMAAMGEQNDEARPASEHPHFWMAQVRYLIYLKASLRVTPRDAEFFAGQINQYNAIIDSLIEDNEPARKQWAEYVAACNMKVVERLANMNYILERGILNDWGQAVR